MKISVVLEALTGSFRDRHKARVARSRSARSKSMKADANARGEGDWRIACGCTAAAAAAYAIKGAIDEMDQISKTAQKIGTTTEALSALQYAAKLSDVSVGQLAGRHDAAGARTGGGCARAPSAMSICSAR
jgi:1-aminocyclopropane-1-carboxylate deaminase/D-cysteine desulfhydrase-like pyridoxal-dependent ACC family enzyme